MSTPAALLLDLDGTLVDSERLHRGAITAWLAHRGWELTPEQVLMFSGRRADDVFATVPGPWTGEDPQALVAEIVAHMPHEAPDPVPGAPELVAAARAAGIPLALVTSAGRRWAEVALPAAGVAADLDVFGAVVTRDDIAVGKPDPAPYAAAISRLGVPAAGCVVVEDALAGVQAGVAAGARHVVGVTTTRDEAQLREAGATLVVADLHGLLDRLG